MTFTMPYGYGSTVVTVEELQRKATFYRLHPEMQRRFLALATHLAAQGVPLGVGTGWRIQPSNPDGSALPGFASPGNSWHEGVPVESQENALAIDTVPASSWAAMEPELARFGLRSFRLVNNEPWHIQPIEIPTSRRFATTLPPLKVWTLPDQPAQGGEVYEHPNRRLLDTRTISPDPAKVGPAFAIPVPEADGAIDMELNVQVVAALGDGWISTNGRSALVYDGGRANATISLAPATGIDLRVNGARAHVIVDLTRIVR